MSLLIRSRLSLSKFKSSVATIKDARFLSSDSNMKVEPLKFEESKTVNVAPSSMEKLLVRGGNGFVGNLGLGVAGLGRIGRSSIQGSQANNVIWNQGNLLSTDSWKEASKRVTSANSCTGGFGLNAHMYKINGTTNTNAIRAAAGEGVILRPGLTHGTRCFGSMKSSQEDLQQAKPLAQAPVFRPLSPHLPIYKPQRSSTLSILNRISGAYLVAIALSFYFITLKVGTICFTYESVYQLVFYSSKLMPIALEISALALSYHVVISLYHMLPLFSRLPK